MGKNKFVAIDEVASDHRVASVHVAGVPDFHLADIMRGVADAAAARGVDLRAGEIADLAIALGRERLGLAGSASRGGVDLDRVPGLASGKERGHLGVDPRDFVFGDGDDPAPTGGAPGDILTEEEMDAIRAGRLMGSPDEERERQAMQHALEEEQRLLDELLPGTEAESVEELDRLRREHAVELKDFMRNDMGRPPTPEQSGGSGAGPSRGSVGNRNNPGNQNAPPSVAPKQTPDNRNVAPPSKHEPKVSLPGNPDAGPTGAPRSSSLLPHYLRSQFAAHRIAQHVGPGAYFGPDGPKGRGSASRVSHLRPSYDDDPNAIRARGRMLLLARSAIGPGARPPGTDAALASVIRTLLLSRTR